MSGDDQKFEDPRDFMLAVQELVGSLSYKNDSSFECNIEMQEGIPVAAHIHVSIKRDCSERRSPVPRYEPPPSWMSGVIGDYFPTTSEMVQPFVVLHGSVTISSDFMFVIDWKSMLLDMIYQRIIQLEMHEIKEWFKVGGEHFDKPHGENGEFL